MSKIVHVLTDDAVTVFDTSNGECAKIFKDSPKFDLAVSYIEQGMGEKVFELDVKHVVTSFFSDVDEFDCISVDIEHGVGTVTLHDFNDMQVPLADAIVKKVISMHEQGFSATPMMNFISRLYDNPSPKAIDELYGFIEKCNLPITEDGCFIAYKIVEHDYMDIFSSTIRNMVGDMPVMPRHLVDDDCNQTCSRGLHFCSKEYLPCYGTSSSNTDRCMIVKISPADVVAIPSDYNNAKGRTWTYLVVGEVEGNWREALLGEDYTKASVVDSDANEFDVDTEINDDMIDVDSISYRKGYIQGYSDGKGKLAFVPRDSDSETIDYDDGYDHGYKDGKGHRAKKFK